MSEAPKKNANIVEITSRLDVIDASKVTLNPGFRPRRVVLRKLPGEFVTHAEYLHVAIVTEQREGSTYDVVKLTHDGFDHGRYFSFGGMTCRSEAQALAMATADFDARR